MQEHEFIYEYEPGQSGESGSAREVEGSEQELLLIDDVSEREVVSQGVHENEMLEEMRDKRATLRLGRGLVMGLGVSFLACLAALWFSGTLLSAPDQILPLSFLQMLAANRVLILCAPMICLVICYASLRSLTAEITAMPEHLLDERQKTLRDQAHRSAFKIIKWSSVLIPIGFVLPHLPWFNPSPAVAVTPLVQVLTFYDAGGSPLKVHMLSRDGFPYWHRPGGVQIRFVANQPAQLIQPASMLEIALAGGLLLLTLVLMFSVLPMAVLAWKGKV